MTKGPIPSEWRGTFARLFELTAGFLPFNSERVFSCCPSPLPLLPANRIHSVTRFPYTLCLQKHAAWCLIITLANVDWFSKFFHQLIRKKILYVCTTKISTSPYQQYAATLPYEIRKYNNVMEFAHCTWQLICLTKI